MGVGSDHHSGPAVEIMGQRLFFRCGFGVEIEKKGNLPRCGEKGVRLPEGTVDGGHENPSLEIGNGETHAVFLQHRHSLSGAFVRVVRRADDPVVLLQDGNPFGFVPDVVPRGHAVDPEAEEFVGDFPGDSLPGGGVLAVGDNEVKTAAPLPEEGKHRGNSLAPGASHDISDKEYPHFSPISRIPSPWSPA
jgi:hypothetical protein